MGLASQLYAGDYNGDLCGDSLVASTVPRQPSDDDENWSYPQYLPNSQILVCPSTQNVVDNTKVQKLFPSGRIVLVNSENTAKDKFDTSGGMSYELFGAIVLDTPKSILTKCHKVTQDFIQHYALDGPKSHSGRHGGV